MHPRWDTIYPPYNTLALPYSDIYGFTKLGKVLTVGGVGAWDENLAHPASAVVIGDTIYLYYHGERASDSKRQIGLATAPISAPETLTKYTGNPILTIGAAAAWDEKYVWLPKIIYDPYESDAAKRWKMWFEGWNSANVAHIGYAYSADGKSWTKYATNPLTDPAGFLFGGLCVVRAGNLYMGVYCYTGGLVGLATSPDGITWTYRKTILTLGAGGTWDDTFLRYTSVTWILGVWYAMYSGYDGTNYRLGLATSSDGFTYTKFLRNPVVDIGAGGAWDSLHVAAPSLFQIRRKFYVYYVGYVLATGGEGGLATVP